MIAIQAVEASSDWKVPAWQISAKGSNSRLQSKLAALAAPLPAPGITPSNSLQLKVDATTGAGPAKPAAAEDAPSMADEDLGEQNHLAWLKGCMSWNGCM